MFDFFLVSRKSHRATEQAVLKVHHQLHPAVHKGMHRHECRLFDSAKPAGRQFWEIPQVISNALEEVVVCFSIHSRTSCQYNVVPLG